MEHPVVSVSRSARADCSCRDLTEDRTAMNATETVAAIEIAASLVVTMLLEPPLPSGVDQVTGS